MPGATNGRRSGCPLSFALDIFGDRWTLLVVRDLLFAGKTRFGEFLASAEGIATNTLSDRLRRLAAVGIVQRRRDPANPGQTLYVLTERGLDLTPVLLAIIGWSGRHDPDTAASPAFLERLDREPGKVIDELTERARRRNAGSPVTG